MPSSIRLSLVAAAVALMAAAPQSGTAQQPAGLSAFTAQYSARYKNVPASGVMVLAPRNNQWSLAMNVNNVAASMSQATLFTESRGRLMPLGGADQASYLGQRKSVPARFDWRGMQATWSGDAKASRRGPVAIQVGDVDGLLLQLALARDVPAGRPLNYRVVENGKARPMQFRRAGTENVTVNGRTLAATKVVDTSDGKTTTVWIAAGVPAPVRLTQQENGSETLRLQMTSWR